MKLFRLLLIAACFAAAGPSFAQPTPESIANAAFEDLKKGDAQVFIDNMLAKAPLIPAGPSEKTTLVNTLNTLLASYGKVEGWELIHSRNASSRYVEHTYMVFQEKYALQLEMKFYRGADGWATTAFKFNDKLDDLLDTQ